MTVMKPFNPWAAKVGDKVQVTVDGRDYILTVHNVSAGDPGLSAQNARAVMAHIRPGGYGITLYPDNVERYQAQAVEPPRRRLT